MNPTDLEPAAPAPAPFALVKGVTLLGRREDADLVLEDTACSKTHCRIFREGDGYKIVDLDSQNGTFVNEERVQHRVLKPGDRVRVGFSVFLFQYDPGAPSAPAVLSFLKKLKPAGASAGEAGPAPEAPPAADAAKPAGEAVGSGPVVALSASDAVPGSASSALIAVPLPAPGSAPAPVPAPAAPEPAPAAAPKPPAAAPAPPAAATRAPAARPVPAAPWNLAAAMIVLAAAVLFGEELRAFLGLSARERPDAPAPAAAPDPGAAKGPGPALQEELRGLRASLRASEDENARRVEEKLRALESALAVRMERLDGDRESAAAALESIRREIAELRAELRAGGGARPEPGAGEAKAPGPEKELPPAEKLFREVMEALEKK
ncbi:MAG: FHA domain-containing protein [Planctomycetes bacterium]|nr:FHA domain-containing protein [Planctomycetota bacterium]